MNAVMMAVSTAALASACSGSLWILGTLLYEGAAALLRPSLFTQMTPPPGNDGGLANAIFGSVMMAAAGTAIGTPIGHPRGHLPRRVRPARLARARHALRQRHAAARRRRS